MITIKKLTNAELGDIQTAVNLLARSLNIPADTIIRILADGADLNTVPSDRYEYMLTHLKRNNYVKTEKKFSFTGKPDQKIIEDKVIKTFDLIDKVKFPFTFNLFKNYRIAIKEINS